MGPQCLCDLHSLLFCTQDNKRAAGRFQQCPHNTRENCRTNETLWGKQFYLFIYVWLCWVFVAACRFFSGCGERGLLSSCGAQTLGRSGFSPCGCRALEQRLGSSGTWASLLCRLWGLDQVRSLPVCVEPRVDASLQLGLCLLPGSCLVWTRVIN